ncbi:hypothetical protein CAPTEDRAFT_208338 [Capitella teleta]|uniref:WSC domain-containing protein n=1 Tax=Capitella teleta TaxID=283909 RepID=R7UT49_CAPTE|nr:hypothetical protein CAPTEDRAFT_208338 [Capitella teleta]|eukprot:ELU09684.1 hypothetical protein CAPTEDRAFT_208338 [Capitella teleta]
MAESMSCKLHCVFIVITCYISGRVVSPRSRPDPCNYPSLHDLQNGNPDLILNFNEPVLLSDVIVRSPWTWHTTKHTLLGLQGCFNESDLQHFKKKLPLASAMTQTECMAKCRDNDYTFAALQMNNSDLLCSCGYEIPKVNSLGNYCAAKCTEGDHVCGIVASGSARIMALDNVFGGIYWNDNDFSNLSFCCELRATRHKKEGITFYFFKTECGTRLRPLCAVSDSNGEVDLLSSGSVMTWFEAQTWCSVSAGNRSTMEVTLKIAQRNIISVPYTTHGFWAQCSTFGWQNTDRDFSRLPWADPHPMITENTCIKATKNSRNEIEIISTNCSERNINKCSDPTTSSTEEETSNPTVETSISGADSPSKQKCNLLCVVIGVCIAVVIIVLGVGYLCLLMRKRRNAEPTSQTNPTYDSADAVVRGTMTAQACDVLKNPNVAMNNNVDNLYEDVQLSSRHQYENVTANKEANDSGENSQSKAMENLENFDGYADMVIAGHD